MIFKINASLQSKGITIVYVQHHLDFSKSESHVIISTSNRVRNGVARWSRDSFWHAQPCRLGILSDRQLIPPVAIKWSWNCPLSGLWQYIEQSGNSDRWSQQLSVLLRRSYVAFSVSRAARLTADFGDGDEWDDLWSITSWSNCHFPFVRRNTFRNKLYFLLKLK